MQESEAFEPPDVIESSATSSQGRRRRRASGRRPRAGRLRFASAARAILAAGSALVSLAAGCSARPGAAARRPDAPEFAQTLGVSCRDGASATPFVIDLPPEERGEVELSLKRGLAVVAYDCERLEPLPGCTLPGSYSFAGYTRRERVLHLDSEEVARVNLPSVTLGARGSLGAHFERGATLVAALAMVGQKSGSRRLVLREELAGDCARATHFISAATLGAFTLATNTTGEARSAVELFGAGVAGESRESLRVVNRDGTLSACRSAGQNATQETEGCGAPLRLRLQPLVEGEQPPGAGDRVSDASEATARCPEPYHPDDVGRCVAASEPHFCDYSDAADCEVQCERGSLGSCAVLGRSLQIGRGVARDPERAARLLMRSCQGGVSPACGRVGELLMDTEETREQGRRLLEASCRDGWARGCTLLGARALKAGRASVGLFDLFERACRAGDAEGCWSLGVIFQRGVGVPKNQGEARRYFERSCDAGARLGCSTYAEVLAAGQDAPPDPEAAVRVLQRACKLGYSASCSRLSQHYLLGEGVERDVARGVALLERACQGTDFGSCFVVGMRYLAGTGVEPDTERARAYLTRACEHGLEMACSALQPERRTSDAS